MSITTTHTRSTRRLGLASTAVATTALFLLASGCGADTVADQAPASISGPRAGSTDRQSPADRAECLVDQAKHQDASSSCTEPTPSVDTTQPLYLAPSAGRPVPLPVSAAEAVYARRVTPLR